jgi:hypothetical protein
MNPPMADDPESIQQDEAREELRDELHTRGSSGAGYAIYDFIAIAVAIVGGAIAFETIDNWSQWVVLGAIIVTLIGFMIAISPNRRGI